ncbi:RNA polymerase, sigma-24 subunit, ECF subfamily [Pirellula staleyi DSM 6068]|uniref:RNA polymerase, sigma-24 subunit, ECF subfamily n=1 Tax=Pirellula staleyi (strain ATCC 27377 / DSM 6068 / ICPB 4128) TaxID=530564 RepID=D2R3P3_PIRSD|nr:RNA polymerase, sigma-24 subunit, ECF subfamily [Pirellula staleyi DSM 6068]
MQQDESSKSDRPPPCEPPAPTAPGSEDRVKTSRPTSAALEMARDLSVVRDLAASGEATQRRGEAYEVSGHHALVQAVQRGDKKAFSVLIELYQQTVLGFLRARLTEHSDAEDLSQEVFLRCYLGRERLDRASAVGSWLIGIARNVLREHVRKRQRRKEVAWTELCLEIDELRVSVADHDDESMQHLPACISSLGPSARQAIELRYGAQLRMAKIAEYLKRSEGAVKLLVHRARQALKHCLDTKRGGAA